MLAQPLAGTQVGRDFVIAEWTAEPADYWIAPLHRHRDCDEAWYVLDGALEFVVDGERFTANSGSAVYVRKGSTHSFRNASSGSTRYLICMTEKTARLVKALHAGEASDPAALFVQYDAELFGWPAPE